VYHTLVYLFFSQLAIGGLISTLMVPHTAGRSFFRFCGILSLVLLMLGILSGPYSLSLLVGPFSGRSISLLLLVLSSLMALLFVSAVILERQAAQKPLLAFSCLLGMAGLILDGYYSLLPGNPWWVHSLSALYFVVSALFLGSVIFSMILGHWYLVVPSLPISPLRSLTLLMVLSIIAKLLLACITLYVFWTWGDEVQKETLTLFAGIGGFFLWARVLFGFLGPLLVALMTWETVKINSTQSATGLLYVATIFAIIGEILSKHIFHTNAIPI
jgi:hypothetical protein